MKSGSCLCGKVQLTFDAFERPFRSCHCTQCRKQTGTYVTAGHVLDDQLSVQGGEHLSWYRASDFAERGFCQHCGSLLLWKKDNVNYTAVMAGCIDGKTETELVAHIFVDDKGDYYELNDGVPAYSGTAGPINTSN